MAFPIMSTSVPWSLVKSGFKKTPRFNTVTQKAAAGRRNAFSLMPYPGWDFEVDLNAVAGGEAVAGSVLQSFLGTYMSCLGAGQPFLFTDPNDSAVAQAQGILLNVTPGATSPMGQLGDGTSTQFQLARLIGVAPDVLQNVSNVVPFVNGSSVFQNLVLQSEALDNSAWTLNSGSVTVTANATTAPDGTTSADKLVETATTQSHILDQFNLPANNNDLLTISAYAKQAERSWFVLGLVCRDGTTPLAWFNLGTGAVGNVSAGYTAQMTLDASGFYRCSMTGTIGSGATSPRFRMLVSTGNGVTSYAGVAGDGIYLWGTQAVKSATISPYYKTTTAIIDGGFSVGSTGIVTFHTAPPNAATLQWSGNFKYLCQFTDDTLKDLARVNKNSGGFLWDCSSVAFESVFV